MLSFKECEKAVQGIREVLYSAVGYDTNAIEVWVSSSMSGSYCYKDKGRIHIVMGVISQSPERWAKGDSFDAYLLHEFAHAWLFDHAHKLSKYHNRKFKKLFGDLEDQPSRLESWFYDVKYNRQKYVSEYASISPEEDFAETFAAFFSEQCNSCYSSIVHDKLRFVGRLLSRYSSLGD